jgi:acyl-CoA-binding protein
MEPRGRLTLYSLYKQINESDADEVPGNSDVTGKIRYDAWLKQKGKSVEQC